MQIIKCVEQDIPQLAAMNKRLIEDEKSNNPMNMSELENRMKCFLDTEYDAFFFRDGDDTAGYALVKRNCSPPYLRQFYIERNFRRKHFGTEAFRALLGYLKTDSLDIEVLTRNETGMRFWEKLGFEEISRYMRYNK